MKHIQMFFVAICLVFSSPISSLAQSKDKKEAKAESKKDKGPKPVKFEVEGQYKDTFERLATWLKKADYTIDKGDLEIGQIATTMFDVKGGLMSMNRTGTRVLISFIKESDTMTTVAVSVVEQKQPKFPPGSVGETKIHQKKTDELAAKIKADILP